MSSHHFVKEDQEPALLILNPKAISFEKVQELLEWSPTVIVVEQALQEVLGWGIKIDILLCFEENVNALRHSLVDQSPIRFISYHHESETLSIAYYFLAAAKYKAVNILINEVSQLDFIQSFAGMNVEVFYEGKRWVYINSIKFEKWVSTNTQFFVYPDLALIQVRQIGLSKELKCLKDGVVIIEVEKPFWLGESLDN